MSGTSKTVTEASAQSSHVNGEISLIDTSLNCMEGIKHADNLDEDHKNEHTGDNVTNNTEKPKRKVKRETKSIANSKKEQEWETESDEQNFTDTSLIKAKGRLAKKFVSDTELDNDQISKPKQHRSRLSMNSESGNKRKLKENGSQGTITSFFKKILETEQLSENLDFAENCFASDSENILDCVKSKLINSIVHVKGKETIIVSDLPNNKYDSVCTQKRRKNVQENLAKITENNSKTNAGSVHVTDVPIKKYRKKQKAHKLADEGKKKKKSEEKINTSKENERNMETDNNDVNVSFIKEPAKPDNCDNCEKSENSDDSCNETCERKEFKKVRFSDKLREISPEPFRKHPESLDSEFTEELTKRNEKQFVEVEEKSSAAEVVPKNCENEDVEIVTDQDDSASLQASTESCLSNNKVRNAFTFMMGSRHKSIGQNLEGKEVEKLETTPELSKEKKKKLSARKAVFEDWANMKGAKKRKIEDDEKGAIIEDKLKKRAKRLKKMLTKKDLTEDVNVSDCEDKSEIVAGKKKVARIFESDSECTSNSYDTGNTESSTENKNVLNKEGRHKQKFEGEKKLLQVEQNTVVVSDEAVDNEMFLKRKKPKLLVSSDSSGHDSDVIIEHVLKNNLKKGVSNAALQQMELSSFFGVLNKSKKTEAVVKGKTKLQMNRTADSSEKPQKNRKVKTKCKSKLTLKKNPSSSDDSSISHTEAKTNSSSDVEITKIASSLIDLENEAKDSNIAELEAVLTPRSIKRWRMRLRVNLAAAGDAEVKSELTNAENDSEVLQNTKRKAKKLMGSSDSDSDDEPLASKKYCKEKLEDKLQNNKAIKLAPLFIRSKPKPKAAKLDEATIEARRRFLHSGIPDSLKITLEKQQRVEEFEYEIFPTVSHVTVKPTDEHSTGGDINFWALPKADLKFTNFDLNLPEIGTLNLGSVTSSTVTNKTEVDFYTLQKINVKDHLKQIKAENQNYPVYRAFRFLHQKHSKNVSNKEKMTEFVELEAETKKRKRGRPKKKSKAPADDDVQEVELLQRQPANISQQEIWTDLYKPSTSEEIFGNHGSVSQLKTWLETWLEFSEEINMQRSKRNCRHSDSSDFESTDADSRDMYKLPGNTVILCGPHGSGKTTAVYTLCNELGINVLELNASSKRTGKRLLQELQEATQSHQVRENDSSSLNSFLRREKSKAKASLQGSQSSDSQSSTSSKKMCLLLIEDVDIVFEQDENFITALWQLLTTSKRPVVLTTTDRNCLHLRRFTHNPIIHFSALSAKILGTWLQVLCLVEGLHVDRQTVVELLEQNRGDARSTLLQLQFWVQSGGQSKVSLRASSSSNSRSKRFSVEENVFKDDSSNISWLPEEETSFEHENTDKNIHGNCLESFGYFKKRNQLMVLPLDLGGVWWNLPDLLHISPPIIRKNKEITSFVKDETIGKNLVEENSTQSVSDSELTLKQKTANVNHTASKNLRNALNIFETLAVTDLLYAKLSVDCDFEPAHKNRNSRVKNGMELNECMVTHSSDRDLAYDWSNMLLDGYVNIYTTHEKTCSDKDFSVCEAKHWRAKQNKCDEALSEAVPFISHLDRNSVNTDYLSTLRTIARSEVIRASNNNKRRSRFYNYLRGIGISCNDSLFETACNAFQHEN